MFLKPLFTVSCNLNGHSRHDKFPKLFKKLNDFILEFRTLYNNKAYRLFSFWDKIGGKETVVVATHGILKTTQKTPPKEIKKAEEIRKQYLDYRQAGLNNKTKNK